MPDRSARRDPARGAVRPARRFPFLEGRGAEGDPAIPMVPDATVWKVLQSLVGLDGERFAYRTLDVEQIGSVYEAVMGFRVEATPGRSIAAASQKRTGAAVVVELDRLLELDGGKRAKELQDSVDRKLTGEAATSLRDAAAVEDIVAALDRAVDRDATPNIVPAGTPVLQSRVHEVWARFFGSSLEDRLRYTTADCFETFPFPISWDTDSALEAAGRAYHEHRAAVMVDDGEGMTKTYNRFQVTIREQTEWLQARRLVYLGSHYIEFDSIALH